MFIPSAPQNAIAENSLRFPITECKSQVLLQVFVEKSRGNLLKNSVLWGVRTRNRSFFFSPHFGEAKITCDVRNSYRNNDSTLSSSHAFCQRVHLVSVQPSGMMKQFGYSYEWPTAEMVRLQPESAANPLINLQIFVVMSIDAKSITWDGSLAFQ